uniref:Uncharacterized protein n=1 Tax=Romanomermis culicivorax TaxID=13658 RepID=A0A915KMG7_ROMCU
MIKILFIFGIFRSKTAASSSSDDDKCDSYSKNLDQSSFCSNNGSLNQENKKNWALIPYSQFENSNTDILPLFSVKQRRVKIGNLEFNFDQDWRGSGVAGVVWDASLSLAEYLLNDRSLEGNFILELGSGASAIPSLVCASQEIFGFYVELNPKLEILLAIRFRYEREKRFLNLVENSGFDVEKKFYDKIRDIYIYSIENK